MHYPSLRSCLLLLGLILLGSCSSEHRQSEPQHSSLQTEQRRITLSAQALSRSFSDEELPAASSARAVNFDLGTKGAMTDPKFKGLSAGSKFLCIIRSSNSAQPINYLEIEWKRDNQNNNKYYIEQSDGTYSFDYVPGQSLGQLSMMIVVGGSWDATTKRLNFSPQISKVTTVSGREEAVLDVPYISEWLPLDIEDSQPHALKVKLRGYTRGSSPEPAFTLQPQGMLLRMRVENEMLYTDGKTRDLTLSKLYIRSTAYAGAGYYDLSEAAVRAGVSKPAETRNAQLLPWAFSDAASYKQTTFDLSSSPLDLPYNGTGRSAYNRYGLDGRTFYSYPNSPWLLCWVKPTGQAASDVGQKDGAQYRVRTEVFAEVEDTRSNTVYSNVEGVDKLEAAGRIVVPSMKALPVYASRKLTVKNGQNAPYVNGAAYRLTLNVQRMPMALDLLSEEALTQDGSAFDDGSYSNIGYFNSKDIQSEAQMLSRLPLTQSGNWRYPRYETLATITGTTTAVPTVPQMNFEQNPAYTGVVPIYPNIYEGIGNYRAEETYEGRSGQAFTFQRDASGNIVVYAWVFYPSKQGGNLVTSPSLLNADHLSITKYEYAGTHNGIPRMKITQRYFGSYAQAAHLDETFAPNAGRSQAQTRELLAPLMTSELRDIVADADTFWNDPLLSQDDVVRYFPLLGYKTPEGVLTEYGEKGYLALGYQLNRWSWHGSSRYGLTYLLQSPYGSNAYQDAKEYYPIRLVRPQFK